MSLELVTAGESHGPALVAIVSGLPAGLVLYWTVSNILQILQQWFMDRPATRGGARETKEAGRA